MLWDFCRFRQEDPELYEEHMLPLNSHFTNLRNYLSGSKILDKGEQENLERLFSGPDFREGGSFFLEATEDNDLNSQMARLTIT